MQNIPNERLSANGGRLTVIPIMHSKENPMKTQTAPQINAEGQRGSFNLNLNHRAIFSVPDAAAVRFLCTEGAVWITLDGDPRDVVLQRCQDFTSTEHRRAVVYALQPSKVTVAAVTAPVPNKANARQGRFALGSWPSFGLQMASTGLS